MYEIQIFTTLIRTILHMHISVYTDVPYTRRTIWYV